MGYKNSQFIYAPKLYDEISDLFEEIGFKFDYRTLPDDNEIFEEKEEGYTDTSTGIIYLKESVMEEACKNSYKRGTFTLIHELGHYLLHYIQSGVKLTRVPDDEKVPIFCDPEWQANTFASEFLMPFEECLQLSVEEIRRTYHVSRKAAEVRFNKINKIII